MGGLPGIAVSKTVGKRLVARASVGLFALGGAAQVGDLLGQCAPGELGEERQDDERAAVHAAPGVAIDRVHDCASGTTRNTRLP